jgi:hypothetical protein
VHTLPLRLHQAPERPSSELRTSSSSADCCDAELEEQGRARLSGDASGVSYRDELEPVSTGVRAPSPSEPPVD